MSGTFAPEAPELLADGPAIHELVNQAARSISADHPDGVVLVGVLKGSMIFLADLARRLTVPARIEFVAVAPFDGTAGRTRVVKDLDRSVDGQGVVLVNGIIDTGLTCNFLSRHLRESGASSLRVATFADKRVRRIVPLEPDYRVVDAPDRFLIGYGLDYRGLYRNLSSLWAADGRLLAEEPDRYVASLYGGDARL